MRKTLLLLVLLAFGMMARAQDNAATIISDFDTAGIDGWWTYVDNVGSTFAASVDSDVVFDGTASLRYDFSVNPSGFAGAGFDFGTPYDWREGRGIVFRLRASEAGIPVAIVLHLSDDTQTSTQTPGISPFAYTFTTPEGSETDWVEVNISWDGFERLFWMGDAGIIEFTAEAVASFEIALEGLPEAANTGTLWFDNIRVISETDLNQPPSYSEVRGVIQPVVVNNLGYRPTDAKFFITTKEFAAYTLVNNATDAVVHSGEGDFYWGFDPDSQSPVYRADFSDFQTAGAYRVVIDGVGESYPFDIAEDVYTDVTYIGMRALYLQRSAIDINDADISGLTLSAGHTAPAVLWDDPSVSLDVSGGWYDAGDYGRYIPTGTFAVNQLLLAYAANPELFPDGALDIPESGNGVPDLLDEIRWELEWLFKMQREDGAVHHKVTTRSFPSYGTLASDDTAQMYVFGVSSADAAYFAGAMAQASVIYADIDPDFAAKCLEAAQRAWAWLMEYPEQFPAGGFQNPPISEYPMQGGYDFVGIENVPRMWAAAELFKATGDTAYQDVFKSYFVGFEAGQAMSWANFYPMALYAYLTADDADTDLTAQVAAIFQAQAAEIHEVSQMSPYQVALNDGVEGFYYVWGSNQVALAHGLYLMLADSLFPTEGYAAVAKAQVDYLLGLNPLAYTYVGGIGENSVLRPHHNVSYHYRISVPGFVTEGPNSQGAGGDAVLIALRDSGAPVSHSYIDDWDSWASNEPTVDANATFTALMAYVLQP
jgi:endoglucanase